MLESFSELDITVLSNTGEGLFRDLDRQPAVCLFFLTSLLEYNCFTVVC